MANYTGIGWDTTNITTKTAKAGDEIQVAGGLQVAEGITVTAQGLEVQADGMAITGNSTITGNLTVTGNLITQDQVQVLIKDNFIDLNVGYVGTAYEQTGMTFNYQGVTGHVFTVDSNTNNLTFVAGTTSARARLTLAGASVIAGGTFTANDILQISGTTNGENDGIYIVHDQTSADTIDIKSSTLTSPDVVNAAFALLNFTAQTQNSGTVTIAKVNLMALRASSAGLLQSATGNLDTDFQNVDYTSVGAATTLQEAYNAGSSILTAGSNPVALTLAADAAGFSVQGNTGGDGNVSIGGTTAVSQFVVNASGAASSITSTSQNFTLATATSGAIAINSAGTLVMDSDDNMTITMDADADAIKDLTIQANNVNAGGSAEGNIILDADTSINGQIGGTQVVTIQSSGFSLAAGSIVDEIIDDDTFSTGVDANSLATSESIKAYVDNGGRNANYNSLAPITADGTGLTLRDVVSINASGAATKGSNASGGENKVVGFAISNAAGSATVYVAQHGTLGGFTGLSAGSKYYLGTAGGITATAPSATGETVYQVGYALTASVLVIDLRHIMVYG